MGRCRHAGRHISVRLRTAAPGPGRPRFPIPQGPAPGEVGTSRPFPRGRGPRPASPPARSPVVTQGTTTVHSTALPEATDAVADTVGTVPFATPAWSPAAGTGVGEQHHARVRGRVENHRDARPFQPRARRTGQDPRPDVVAVGDRAPCGPCPSPPLTGEPPRGAAVLASDELPARQMGPTRGGGSSVTTTSRIRVAVLPSSSVTAKPGSSPAWRTHGTSWRRTSSRSPNVHRRKTRPGRRTIPTAVGRSR